MWINFVDNLSTFFLTLLFAVIIFKANTRGYRQNKLLQLPELLSYRIIRFFVS